MRRWLALGLVPLFILVGTTLPAAGSQEGKLLIWADELRASVMNVVAGGFTSKYKIPVEVQEKNFSDIKDQFGTAGPAGTGPDIVVVPHDWLGQFVTSGLVEPVDLLGKQKDFSPAAIKAFTWGKSLYGLPYAIESIGLVYNKSLVPKPPETWTELEAIGAKITDKAKKVFGFTIPQPDPYHTFPMMTATGGYVFGTNPDGTLNPLDIGLNNKGGVRGLELLLKLIKDGVMPLGIDYQTMISMFTEGKVGMIITGPWAFAAIREAKINYGFAKLPTIDGQTARPFVGVQGFMVSSFSKNKLLASAFLNEFVATPETMKALFEKDPRPPAYLPVAAKITDPDVAGVLANANTGVPMPAIPEMSSVWSAWSNAIELVLNGKLAPQKALDEAVAQIAAAIKGTQAGK